MLLLGNRYAPTTFAIGFLECSMAVATEADRAWRANMGNWSSRDLSGSLASHLDCLSPLSGPKTQHLWVSTESRWCAYFDNFINGTDASGCIATLSERIGCRGVLVSCHPNIPGKSYGQSRFDLYGQQPTFGVNCTRSIAATNDGGKWCWDATGVPLHFEQTDHYSNKRIATRLTPALIADYSHAVGINPFHDSFYGSTAQLITNDNIDSNRCRTESFAEVQSKRGFTHDA